MKFLPAWFVNLYRGVQDVTLDAGRQISDGVVRDFVSVARTPLLHGIGSL